MLKTYRFCCIFLRLQTSGLTQREAIKSLSKVALMMFALDGAMMSDTSMVTKVILKDTILDDLRPQSQRGITK